MFRKSSRMIVLLVVFSLLFVPVALAEGTTPGEFNIADSQPSDLKITLLDLSGVSAISTDEMTPLVETAVEVKVTDLNTMADVTEVKVVLFYKDANKDTVAPTAGDPQNAAILTWSAAKGTWTADFGGATTWAFDEAASFDPASMTVTTGTWRFVFTPGKVATATLKGYEWAAYAKVTTTSGASIDGQLNKLTMHTYGEIDVLNDSVVWDSVEPGSDFDAKGNEVTDIAVKYIANSPYDARVAASGTWTGSPKNAALDTTGAVSEANQFALKANEKSSLGNSVLVNTTGVSIDDSGTQTAEAGVTVDSNSLWLKLASGFETGRYAGTITYMIVN